jgi:L-gulono-1,4-lactone dehydrogenase
VSQGETYVPKTGLSRKRSAFNHVSAIGRRSVNDSILGGRARERFVPTYDGINVSRPRYVVRCRSIEDVRQSVLASAAAGLTVRAKGAGFSWVNYNASADICLDVTRLNRIGPVDTATGRISVEAGARIGDVSEALAAEGLCLPSLPFPRDLTIGGAIATASHGSSARWGSVSDFVHALSLIDSSGALRGLGPDERGIDLRAARVAVGMMGVLVAVTLQAFDLQWVRPSTESFDMRRFLSEVSALTANYEHVWAHWHLGSDTITAACLASRPSPAPGFHPYVENGIPRWTPPRRVSPLRAGMSAAGRLGRPVLPVGLYTARSAAADGCGREVTRVSMQYGFPLSQLPRVVDAIKLVGIAAAQPDKIIELKFLKASDRTLLGPNSGGAETVALNLWWLLDRRDAETAMDPFETTMLMLGGRPHWGKRHRRLNGSEMSRLFPGWTDFEAVRSRYDPTGAFSIICDPQT